MYNFSICCTCCKREKKEGLGNIEQQRKQSMAPDTILSPNGKCLIRPRCQTQHHSSWSKTSSIFNFSAAIWAITRITSIIRSLTRADWNSDELIIDFKIIRIWVKKYFLRLWSISNLSWSDSNSTSFNQSIIWRNTNFILSVTWQSTAKNAGSKCITSIKS